jgi:large subunit ribosomal protein L24
LRFTGADLAELLPGDGRGPLSGRITFDVDLEGTGRSPSALIGALHGTGMFTLQDGQILRLDPATFAAVIRSVDLGLPVDATRIRDRVESTLASGRLAIPLVEGEVVIAGGQARLRNAVVHAQGADLALSAGVYLADSALDARATLKGPEDAGGPAGTRPEITIALKGPIEAPRRTLEVAALANWLALRTVEQQTKRIDALESGREAPGTAYASPSASVPAPPAAASAPATPQRPAARPAPAPERRAAAKRSAPAAAPEPTPLLPAPLDLRQFLPFRLPGGGTRF